MVERWVEWIEPYGPEPLAENVCVMRVRESTAIAAEKYIASLRVPPYEYKSDKDALDDFIAVHWAQIVEIED